MLEKRPTIAITISRVDFIQSKWIVFVSFATATRVFVSTFPMDRVDIIASKCTVLDEQTRTLSAHAVSASVADDLSSIVVVFLFVGASCCY